MSLMIKFFCCLIVLGLGGLFILKKPDGSPWLSAKDFIPDTSSLKEAIPDQIIGGNDGNVAVYKWKDSEGNWQFSDKPPTNTNAQQVLVDTNLNRDLAPTAPVKSLTSSNSNKTGKAILIKDSSINSGVLSPGNAATLINDAKNVQNIVDERQKQLEAAMPK